MIDIVAIEDDIRFFDTQTTKATNILSVQLGALEYAPDLGIDLRFFLSEEFRFQNESFKSYLVQILANNGINVANLIEANENLLDRYIFELTPAETSGGLIAR